MRCFSKWDKTMVNILCKLFGQFHRFTRLLKSWEEGFFDDRKHYFWDDQFSMVGTKSENSSLCVYLLEYCHISSYPRRGVCHCVTIKIATKVLNQVFICPCFSRRLTNWWKYLISVGGLKTSQRRTRWPQSILELEIFNVWVIWLHGTIALFIWPTIILVVLGYMSKWV